MKGYKIMMWVFLFLMVLCFGLVVEVRAEVWAQVYVGGCLLYQLFLCVRSDKVRQDHYGVKRVPFVAAPDVSVGDVIYDLQEFSEGLPEPEIWQIPVEDLDLYVEPKEREVFFRVNGRIFPSSEYDKTWCLDKEKAEELADELRKDR